MQDDQNPCYHERTNRDLYQDILDEYFRLRHEIFVSERGWRDLHQLDGREIDAYDNDDAIYLLALDEGPGRRRAAALPDRSAAHDQRGFRAIWHRAAFQGLQHVLEWTRYFVVKERRMGRTDCRLLAAIQQFCLEEGITEVTAVVEMWWLPRWHQAGFKVKPLGLPTDGRGPAMHRGRDQDFAGKPGPCPQPRRTARLRLVRDAPLRRPSGSGAPCRCLTRTFPSPPSSRKR